MFSANSSHFGLMQLYWDFVGSIPVFQTFTSSWTLPEVEERLLWSQGSSYLTGAHRSSSQKPLPMLLQKVHSVSSGVNVTRACGTEANCAFFWSHKHTPFLSQSLLSADLSCGCRTGVGKTPGAPVATCCFRRNTACLTTQPHHSWRFCVRMLVCLFVCVLCIQPLVFP